MNNILYKPISNSPYHNLTLLAFNFCLSKEEVMRNAELHNSGCHFSSLRLGEIAALEKKYILKQISIIATVFMHIMYNKRNIYQRGGGVFPFSSWCHHDSYWIHCIMANHSTLFFCFHWAKRTWQFLTCSVHPHHTQSGFRALQCTGVTFTYCSVAPCGKFPLHFLIVQPTQR